MSENSFLKNLKIPKHIAFIMDGNGRWAAAKNLSRTQGHKAGAETVKEVIAAAADFGVKYLTLYAFSTENWARPGTEVSALMKLLEETLDSFSQDKNHTARLIISGRRSGLPSSVLKKADAVAQSTKDNDKITVNLALNYGSRQEISDAVNKLIKEGKKEITEKDISASLYNNLPDPDLIIRTSGEMRLSNFLLWQAAYSELYFTTVLWPDFRKEHLLEALRDYTKRERKFGGV